MSSSAPEAECAARASQPRAAVLSLGIEGMAYGGTAVLGAVALSVRQGETVAVTGPSGIGKTTLLRIAAGLETRFHGTRRVAGRLAMVFQEPVLLPWRTAAENLTLTAGIAGQAVEAALAEVGLAGLGGRYPGQMSLGQQRRLSLARAFAVAPALLLLDEPFVSLDPATADEMMALFAALRDRRGTATLLVTHSADEAARLADRRLRLDGRPAVFA